MAAKEPRKSEHGFYREKKKSWNEYDGKIHWPKIRKTSWKILKWSLGLYLAVAALWGCVQNFIITTSNEVGKGLEVYQNHDQVVSNFYQAEENYIYQINADASTAIDLTNPATYANALGVIDWNSDGFVTNDDLEKDGEKKEVGADANSSINDNGLAPLPFLTINPQYGYVLNHETNEGLNGDGEYSCNTDELAWNQVCLTDINGDQLINDQDKMLWETHIGNAGLFVAPAELQYMAGSIAGSGAPSYSYQVSLYDPNFLSQYLTYDLSSTSEMWTVTGGGRFIFTSNPFMLSMDITDDNSIDGNDDNTDKAVPVWKVYDPGSKSWKYQKKTPSDIGVVDSDGDGYLEYKDNIDIVPTNYADFAAGSNMESVFWTDPSQYSQKLTMVPTVNTSAESYDLTQQIEKDTLYYSQAIFAMNIYAFITGDSANGSAPNDALADNIVLTQTKDNVVTEIKLSDWINANIQDPELKNDALTYDPYLWITDPANANVSINEMPNPPTVTTTTVSSGVGLMLLPSSVGADAIIPSLQAQEEAKNARNSEFDPTSGQLMGTENQWEDKKGYGEDEKTANEGWAILGEDPTSGKDFDKDGVVEPHEEDNGINERNTYKLYADATGTEFSDSNGDGNTDGLLVSQQKSLNKGQYGDDASKGWEQASDTVLNEKVLEYKVANLASGQNSYAAIDSVLFTLGDSTEDENDTTYSLSTVYADFTGMSSIRETGLINDSTRLSPTQQHGAATYKSTVYENSEGEIITQNNSAIDTSIEAAYNNKGYNFDNTNRYAMVTWAEAWAWGGPYYGTFVYPLAYLSMYIQQAMPYSDWGAWGVILGVFLIIMLLRSIGALMSLRKKNSQQKMNELNVQVAQIKSKYADHKTNKQAKQRMQMEIQALYRKHEVNPFQSMSTMLITMPVFLSLWTIISAIPVYKISAIGAFSFAVSPINGMFNSGLTGFIYFLFLLLVIMVQVISTKLPNWLADKRRGVKNIDEATRLQMKKQNRTSTIMLVVFIILGLTIPCLLGLYWVFSSMFTISQTMMQHWWALKKERKKQSIK